MYKESSAFYNFGHDWWHFYSLQILAISVQVEVETADPRVQNSCYIYTKQ